MDTLDSAVFTHCDAFSDMLACTGMALVAKHGAGHTANMLAVFEGYLEARDVADEASYDRVREGVVVLLGTLAQHLDAEGPKVTGSFHPARVPTQWHECRSPMRLGVIICTYSCTNHCPFIA